MPYDIALLIERIAVGTFFTISGYHKLFVPQRRLALSQTFAADGVKSKAFMFLIPGGELLGGLGVLMGVLAQAAALGLIIICLGACFLDGRKRIKAWKPLDPADYLDDVLYLPETLFLVLLFIILASGPGHYALAGFLGRNIHI